MPFKKYREHLIYKRLEKKVSTPPPSTSISLQSVPLATESTRINEERILHQNKESPASSARSSPQTVGPRTLGSFFSTGSSGSNRRPLSSFLINDHHDHHNDEYNAYSYGLVPLSERNIYREFSVIELPSSEKNNNSNNNNMMMNTWSKKSSTSTDYLHHHHHLKVPNGSSNTLPTSHSALKSPPSTSSLHSTSNKGSSSLEREKKTVRIVVEGENEGIKSPENVNKNGQGSSPKPHFRSSFGKKWNGGNSRGEVLIPIRREVSNGSGIRSSSISSTGSGSGKKVPSKSENAMMAMEPVPTPVRSYKCTSYTLNEIRSF